MDIFRGGMLNFGGFVYLHHCQSLIVVAHPFIGVITVITPFRNGRSPHEPTYHSIFNITTLLFQHGCSNILVYLHHSVVVSHLWHIPSTGRGTSQLHSAPPETLRGGSPVAVCWAVHRYLRYLPRHLRAAPRRWWYLAPEKGIATYGDMGTSPVFFLCFFAHQPKTCRKKQT